MTCSGGDSAQGADQAQLVGLSLPPLAPPTLRRLTELLPSAATAANPLDYTALIWGEVETLAELVVALGDDPAIDLVVVFYDQPHGMDGASAASWAAVLEAMMLGAARSSVPTLLSSTLPELLDDRAAWQMACAGVPAAAGLRTGMRCAAAMLGTGRPPSGGERLRRSPLPPGSATARRATGWPSIRARHCCGRPGCGPRRGGRGRRRGGGRRRARLGGELALKLSAASVQHKSEIGAVALALDSDERVAQAFTPLAALAGEHGGVVLAERMASSDGLELIVGAHREGVVPALVIGLGGIWAELLDDVCVVPLPADRDRIIEALRGLRGAPLLFGGRGRPGVDVDALCALAQSIEDCSCNER